jgi:hypothetical protein
VKIQTFENFERETEGSQQRERLEQRRPPWTMVVTATLSKCDGALSCSVPVGKQCVLGRSTARDIADALKLALGVSPKEDGVSRRQATLKIEASGQAKFIVPLGVCNPVKVTSHDGTSMMLQAGRTAFLHSGDIVALDSYNKDPKCKIERLLKICTTPGLML